MTKRRYARDDNVRINDIDVRSRTLGFAALHQRPARAGAVRQSVGRKRRELDLERQRSFAAGGRDDDRIVLAVESTRNRAVNA